MRFIGKGNERVSREEEGDLFPAFKVCIIITKLVALYSLNDFN